ncbi:MAG: DUF1801 domain-containing protein [Acidobacteria bacterium]|nr:DUF1801 domain-containing protein [Acidobacteriota bacterium]
MKDRTPEEQLEGFFKKYTPEVGALAREALARLRARLPGACELVYDNYNALVVGFSPTERASDAVLSVALYPRWVTLFFLNGARLDDPSGLLRGEGKVARHIVLASADDLDKPAVRSLVSRAIKLSEKKFDKTAASRLVVKSVSAKQRPRRPPKK